MYKWDFVPLWQYRYLFLEGISVSIGLTIAVIILGFICGMIAAYMQISRYRVLRLISSIYIEFFRTTPLLVQLMWVYYALPMLIGVEMSAITASILSLSLYGGSFYAEVMRGGIQSIDPGQKEAGLALGMLPSKVMRRIVLPQAFRRMIPPLMNQSILMFKNTSLVSIVAVPDILYQAQRATMDTYRPLEVYTAVALIYVAILVPLTILSKMAERRMGDF